MEPIKLNQNSQAEILKNTDDTLTVCLPDFKGKPVAYATNDPTKLANREQTVVELESTHDIVNINLDHYNDALTKNIQKYVKRECAKTYYEAVGTILGAMVAGVVTLWIFIAIDKHKAKKEEKLRRTVQEFMRERECDV